MVAFAWRLVHADVVWGEAETIRPLYPLIPHMPLSAEWQYMDGIGQWHFHMSLYEWSVFVLGMRALYDYADPPGDEQVGVTFCNDHINIVEALGFTTAEWKDRKWQRSTLKAHQIGNGRILRHGALGPRL